MAYPLPIGECDGCPRRVALTAAAFTVLRGQDAPGYFCHVCRDLYGEAEDAER